MKERVLKAKFVFVSLCEGGGRVALQSHPLRRPAHAGRYDVYRQHPKPVRHQHRQVGPLALLLIIHQAVCLAF